MPEIQLHADCRRCAALCCVATHFDASPDFAVTKHAGVPCPHLHGQRCSIHDQRGTRGFSGCVDYDCHGAGQWITQRHPDADSTWQQRAFMQVRPLFRAMWLARQGAAWLEARGAELGPVEDVRRQLSRLEALCATAVRADGVAERALVETRALLRDRARASAIVRSPGGSDTLEP